MDLLQRYNDMEEHALAILDQNNQLHWPVTKRILESGKTGGKWEIATAKLLYHLIVESQELGGTLLEQFWQKLGACNEWLEENIKSLQEEDFESAHRSFDVLFRGLDPHKIDFGPVIKMSEVYFTHVGVAFMNPGGKKSGASTTYSVGESISEDTDRLLEEFNKEEGFGKRKQDLLNKLSFKRDGQLCLLTGAKFVPFHEEGIDAILAHIIPNSIHEKTATLKCIAMFAGAATTHDIMHHLNTIGNVMNMELNAHSSYDKLKWGIEAKKEAGEDKYYFRKVPTDPLCRSPGFITLEEGDEIQFGKGPEGKQLDKPLPSLCNLQLAVARVLKMSGAADIIAQWKDEADDDGCYDLFITSEADLDMLDAKLFLSGRAVIA